MLKLCPVSRHSKDYETFLNLAGQGILDWDLWWSPGEVVNVKCSSSCPCCSPRWPDCNREICVWLPGGRVVCNVSPHFVFQSTSAPYCHQRWPGQWPVWTSSLAQNSCKICCFSANFVEGQKVKARDLFAIKIKSRVWGFLFSRVTLLW